MLFARWQHHLRFGSGFPYAPLKAMVTKISKWSRIQDSFRITPKIESLTVFARHSQKTSERSVHNFLSYLADTQTDRQTDKVWQKHYLLGRGNYNRNCFCVQFQSQKRVMLQWQCTFALHGDVTLCTTTILGPVRAATSLCKEHMSWLKACRAATRPLVGICQLRSTFNYNVQRWHAKSSVNHYDVLGLSPNATQSQIKSAYYSLSKLYHPDTTRNLPNSKEMFARLSAAYEVLSNPHKRALYDREHHKVVGDVDIEYRDFLRRRGTFSPRRSATTTYARSPGAEFDRFYQKHYGDSLRYNWEARRKMETERAPDYGYGSMISSLVVTSFFLFVVIFIILNT